MSYSTIDKPTDYFNNKLFTGNGGTNAITGVGFQPDFTWIKNRSRVEDNVLYDAVRGVTKRLESNTTDAEDTKSNGLTAFGTDGFTVGSAGQNNYNGDNIASWNWLGANGTASNSNGSITSTVSANTTSDFSIVSYTGNGTSGATVGHGLGSVPAVIIVKQYSSNGGTLNWQMYHQSLGNTKTISINLSDDEYGADNRWNNTSPTSSLFSLGNGDETNNNTVSYIAYCFAPKTGYSKFGSYTGNGNADGTFIYTGFKPAFVMIKNSTTNGTAWTICDNKRAGYNAANYRLAPDNTNVESISNAWEMYSNGFKMTSTGSRVNTSGNNYIYMAFGQTLVGSNNIPATAR